MIHHICAVHLYRRKALSMAKISDETKEKKDDRPSINYRVWVSGIFERP